MRSRRLLTVVAAALLSGAVAGGIAYATIPGPGNVFTACITNGTGAIRLIDKSLAESSQLSHCKPNRETEVSWNQTGQQGPAGQAGADGVSVTTIDEPAGGNCAAGGVRLSAATGASYVCNGERGPHGADGQDGAPGPAGPPGVSGLEHVVANGVATQGGQFGRFPVEARCSAGKKVVGGGFGSPGLFLAVSDRLAVQSSRPSPDQRGWYVFVTNVVPLGADEPFEVWAICASG